MGRGRSPQSATSWRGAVIGSGPRLVLVHGGPGLEHRVLLPLAEQLAPWFEVWLPDLTGHGPHPDIDDPSLTRVQRDLARAVASHGGAELVVGHSLGAWLVRDGLRTGALAPRRGAVLLAPPAGGQPRIRPKHRREDPGTIASSLLAQIRAETGRRPSERFVHCLRQATLQPVDAFPRLQEPLALALSRATPRVRPDVDVLVLSGTGDAVVSPHQASEIAHHTSRSTLLTLPGVGHYPAATGDDGVAQAITGFAERLFEQPLRLAQRRR